MQSATHGAPTAQPKALVHGFTERSLALTCKFSLPADMALLEGLHVVCKHLSCQPGLFAQQQASRLIASSAALARYRAPMQAAQLPENGNVALTPFLVTHLPWQGVEEESDCRRRNARTARTT